MKNRAVQAVSSLEDHGDLRGHSVSKAKVGRLATTVLVTRCHCERLKKKKRQFAGSQFERVEFVTMEG